MSRIIAGKAGGAGLVTLSGNNTRPTTGRVREALFSSLNFVIDWENVVVLDLFAGSGALGLEAASRGACRVVLVDNFFSAVKVCKKNMVLLKSRVDCDVSVVHSDAMKYLSEYCCEKYGLVFLDPPYSFSDESIEDLLSSLCNYLVDGARVVVERDSGSSVPVVSGFSLLSDKKYGNSRLVFLGFRVN